MPSVIVLTAPLTDPLRIDAADHPALLDGMRHFGDYHKSNYDGSTAQKAAESIKKTFEYVITDKSCYVYYFSDARSQFIRLTNPSRSGVNIKFDEAIGSNFTIQVNRDNGGNNPVMHLSAPVGDHMTYLDVFAQLVWTEWDTLQDSDCLAASILISRCG